ncbi:hypothetical protein [Mariniradius sediminis]|uniref:N-acetyltransferase domain-containing protein n=1 Tax=Mariniradius sediminis TaxID=2909237 RepID=A0ABS9BUS6_9BACT|nr:hypothetical protein [Mariniradius sediminis]MCF1750921.1 hypothetical protein [Mariniradius sediminis]
MYKLTDSKLIEMFHQVPTFLYRSDPNWMPHLISEIEQIFDRNQNSGFQNGDAERWVLLDRDYTPVGRIAAFYSFSKKEIGVGGIGFYECVDDAPYARKLFEAAETWLLDHGLIGADGPVNFGERHQFWGCQSFPSTTQVYQENYNPAYYNQHFADNGYSAYFDSLSYVLNLVDYPFQRMEKVFERQFKEHYRFEHFSLRDPERYITDYLEISKEAFGLENRIIQIDKETIIKQLNMQRGVMRGELISFVYKADEPIGVIGAILNLSGILNESLFPNPSGKKTIKAFLAAIKKDYQGKGLIAGLIHHATKEILKDSHIERAYLCGIAEHSAGMHSLAQKLKAKKYTVHTTYRKYFDGRRFSRFEKKIN